MVFLSGLCPHNKECLHYREISFTCNSVDPSYCGIYRDWKNDKNKEEEQRDGSLTHVYVN